MFKKQLLKIVKSRRFKRLICQCVDGYVHHTDNTVDDSLARALRAALLPNG